MDLVFIFFMLLIILGLVVYMMLGGGGGGDQGHGAVENRERINFVIGTVREIDVVRFEIDFSGRGCYPFLRRRPTDPLFMDNITYHRICAAVVNNYDFAIDSLKRRLARNGRVYDDADHPVRLDIIYRSDTDRVLETSILIYHSNCYGYCFRYMGSWQYFTDSPYNLVDANGTSVATNIGLDSAYIDDCFNRVGVSTIIAALRVLNSNNPSVYRATRKQKALHLCFCFIEATRFTDVYRLVRQSLWRSFLNSEFYHQVPVEPYFNHLVHSWGVLSNALTVYDNTHVWFLPQEHIDALRFPGTADRQVARARDLVSVRL